MDNIDERVISLFSPEEGFTLGNLFPKLYTPYKNYKPKTLTPQDDKSKLLLEIDKNTFAAHELNLYLDLHPEDDSMIELFNDYRKKSLELIEEYESLYGPLSLQSESLEANPFLWEEKEFPFDGGNIDVDI